MNQNINIPMQQVGPIHIKGNAAEGEFNVPLATYEIPLWPSVNRGARVAQHAGGIQVTLIHDCMTRSVILEADSAASAFDASQRILAEQDNLAKQVSASSRFAKLMNVTCQQVGKLIYLRYEITSGDASGHNMVTLAAEHITNYITKHYPELRYVSISGNTCTDKKNSAINGLLGRGKNVIAEVTIPRKLCARFLKTTPEAICNLNQKKNLLGSLIAGSVRSANAHFANMLLAFYLATGQDAANIVEGSQGFTVAEVCDDALYFSVTLPNLIIGSVGNGKELDFVQTHLEQLGCADRSAPPGDNARKLAAIAAATVLCGELSLLAAQTNPGELMRSHVTIERQKNKGVARA